MAYVYKELLYILLRPTACSYCTWRRVTIGAAILGHLLSDRRGGSTRAVSRYDLSRRLL